MVTTCSKCGGDLEKVRVMSGTYKCDKCKKETQAKKWKQVYSKIRYSRGYVSCKNV